MKGSTANEKLRVGPTPGQFTRAAEYVRMSTEHQRYSTQNQSAVIHEYAQRRGLYVVRTYADEAKSGLRLDGRDALKLLIADVQSGRADFSVVLVYDVSRWGRFQDADESAYYEYICRRSGISVQYCAEQFENDGSPLSTIVKGVKRAMAGEYSRELSTRVFTGQCRLIENGYRQGGLPGFGLRRMLVDQSGAPKALLERGQEKSIQTDRVILVPGPSDELAVVRRIFTNFVKEGQREQQIADALNAEGHQPEPGAQWSRSRVRQILTNAKYTGDNVWNRRSFKLQKMRVRNPPEQWVTARGAFEPIVERQLFDSAQQIIGERGKYLTDIQMLERLRSLYDVRGFLSCMVINEADGLPSSASYIHRFGSLSRAYALVGFTPDKDLCYAETNRALRALHPGIVSQTVADIIAIGGQVTRDEKTELLFVNSEFSTSIVIARHRVIPSGASRWMIRFDRGLKPDVTVAIRMNETNQKPLDYYILPTRHMIEPKLRLAARNGIDLDAYRSDTLKPLFVMAARSRLTEVA